MFDEDHSLAKCKRTLHQQHGFEGFDPAGKNGGVQRSPGVSGPPRHDEIPSPREMFTDRSDVGIRNGHPGHRRLIIDHALTRCRVHVEGIEKTRERDAVWVITRLRDLRDFDQASWAGTGPSAILPVLAARSASAARNSFALTFASG